MFLLPNLSVLVILTILLVGYYCMKFVDVSKKFGIDPAIITYFSPLRLKRHWAARVLFTVAFIMRIALSSPYSTVLAALLLLTCCLHILLLIIFGRQHTQPIVYYLLLALSGIILVFKSPFLFVTVITFLIGEYMLQSWQKKSKTVYDRWVAKITASLDSKYWPHFESQVNELQWFCTLHIATTESIARPKLSRMLERPYFYIRKPRHITSGIMQVKAERLLSDLESLQRGVALVKGIVSTLPKELKSDTDKLTYISKEYNGSYHYRNYLFATYPGFLNAWQAIRLKHFSK